MIKISTHLFMNDGLFDSFPVTTLSEQRLFVSYKICEKIALFLANFLFLVYFASFHDVREDKLGEIARR